ncbi:hypothetical protein Tco_1359008, partial [Tanacetum coccineum]
MATNEEHYDQPLAMTTTNIFEVNHEDAYDSDVDEGPNAAVAFMANLSSTSATNSQVNEVHSNDNQIFDNVDYQKDFSEKKDLADSYLDEIVCLKNANKVARDMLQRFNMPTHTIPMLSKKPKAATADLHKDLLDEEKPRHVRPANGFYDKLNAMMFVPQKELSQEQAYWLSANEIASNASNPATPVTPFVHNRPPPSQVLFHLQKVNAVFHQFEGTTEGSCDQQALETDRIQLKDTITSLRIQLDGLKVENVSLKRRYDELSKANTQSRTTYTEKINALTAEIAKLKTELSGKKSGGSTASEKPKVLASGMYTKSSKYFVPPKRANWVQPTPLPKKKQ